MAREIIRSIKGMHDELPGFSETWRWIEDEFRGLVGSFGYSEIRFPLLEKTELFKRSIGEVTDIVEKEMFSFEDAGGDYVSLRPEGTAGCVRAAEQHGLLYNSQQRLWYRGPMFRRERPQKGRYRQFHQFGLEAFGMAGPGIDAEIIEVSAKFWRRLETFWRRHRRDLGDSFSLGLSLELNNIGSSEDRRRYSAVLGEYLNSRADELDPAARSRIATNPLRVLDSKHPGNRRVVSEAPSMESFLSQESVDHHEELERLLKNAGIKFNVNRSLVRGLDYYNYSVFEWTTDRLGAQGAVCGGGRYDGLVAQLGGRPTPAAGFAIGVERVLLLLQETMRAKSGDTPFGSPLEEKDDIRVIVSGRGFVAESQALARRLREQFPNLRVVCKFGGGKVSPQVKRAYRQKVRILAVLGMGGAEVPQEIQLRHWEKKKKNYATSSVEDMDECVGKIRELLFGDREEEDGENSEKSP